MQSFAALLTSALQRSGFAPDVTADADTDPVATEYAAIQAARLRLESGEDWAMIVQSVAPDRTEADLVRIAGFGSAITEFSTGFLCNQKQREELSALGALFNLIAALYDYFLDHPLHDEPFVLKRETLVQAVRNNNGTGLQSLAHTGTLRERVMAQLILRYLGQLQKLTSPHTPAHCMQTFGKLIVRMFDAQNATVQNNVTIPAYLAMRKSALSIVALGFPVWLAGVQHPACTYFAHLRWMYSLGDFISWVNDFADFEQDRDAGAVNRLLADTAVYPYERALRVAQLGQQIMKFRENLRVDDKRSALINNLFTKYIYNWLKL